MKNSRICFVVLFSVCVLMPSGAMADLFMIGFYSPFARSPGSSFSFEFRIQDENGPVEGQKVTFSVSPDDGTVTLNPTSATTDSNGAVTTRLNTGSGSTGVYRVTATAGNASSGGNATIKTPPPPPELSISVVSGPGSGAPGDTLTFTVEVQEDGSAASGKTVTFSITSGDGNASLNSTSATTGNNGQASTTLTLGSSASGSYTVTATVGSKSTSGTATVDTPSPPLLPESSISVVRGPGSGKPGDSLTFTVEVQEDGSPAAGKTVTFSITSGDGHASLNSTSATTGSDGQASTTLTLGGSASGSYTVTATVGSKSTSGTATVDTPEVSIQVVSGPGSGKPGQGLFFVVEVQEDGSAASGKTVTFSVSPDDGTVSLDPTNLTTNSNGRARALLLLLSGASGSYTVTATVGSKSTSGTATVGSVPPPPELSISVVNGPGAGDPGDALTFTVEVQEDGSPVSGKTVAFSITSGDGNASLNPTSVTTDSNGQASTTLTLGNSASGSYAVQATVGSKSTSETATVGTPPPPRALVMFLHHSGSVLPGGTVTFTAEVKEDGDSVQGQSVVFSVSPNDGSASLSTASAITDSVGHAQTMLMLGSDASGAYTITASIDSLSVSSTETVDVSSPSLPPLLMPEPTALSIVSGDNQEGMIGEALVDPFVVEVRDQNGSPLQGITVTFAVTSGGGSLSATTAMTGANGRAESTLTLGNEPGANSVEASVEGVSQTTTFNAKAGLPPPVPTSLSIVSGENQEGMIGEALASSFVIEVGDQYDAPMAGVTVTFAVTSGRGSLTAANAMTGANGRAESTLTLGNEPGTNRVEVSVEGMSQTVTFNAEASLPLPVPTSLVIVSGDDQSGLVGEALASSFVIEVRDQYDKLMTGVTVTFAVTAGNGSLSAASAMTGANGRAESTLTLGNDPGTNRVEVSVEGVSQTVTFNAEASLPLPVATSLSIVSGENQEGMIGEALASSFVIEVRDQYDEPMTGVTVTFAVTAGNGSMSSTTAMTGANGRAESTLRLGSDPGTNSVDVSVEGISQTVTFNAEASLPPPVATSLSIISGSDQSGWIGEALASSFVIEVRDQYDEPMTGVTVTFAVTAGNGSLSAATAMTGANGRAESTLRLGSEPGTNRVEVSVEGISQTVTFNAEASLPPPVATSLSIVSGGGQSGLVGEGLTSPFVVEVLDQYGSPLKGVGVTFSITSGSGSLSAATATTGANGRAESTLTLGSDAGTHSVETSVEGISQTVTFTAEADLPPPVATVLSIVSGDNQEGMIGEALENPFVAEVRDQYDAPMEGVQVNFAVSAGGGSLSDTSVYTNDNGLAQSTLTLGQNTGTNTVTVSVTGVQGQRTFNAEGIRIPLAFWIITGFDQKGVIGEALGKPFVVEVRDRAGERLPGVQVTFTVTGGGGTLSATSETTDANGRVEVILTLGPYPGNNTVEVAAAGIPEKQTVSAIAELPPIPEDINGDDVVNILDLVSVASNLGDEGTDFAADINGDGVVNILDLVMVAAALGDTAAAPSALGRDIEAGLTRADVRQWITQAQGLDLTDAARSGIVFLEQLLVALTPKETVLLPNYPNPFNPETWIPYRLAHEADVQVAIYDAGGSLVRQLNLGHQPAGFYTEQTKAVYWDGCNQHGEGIASGLYFYTLRAGEFTATRKMLIMK